MIPSILCITKIDTTLQKALIRFVLNIYYKTLQSYKDFKLKHVQLNTIPTWNNTSKLSFK